MADSMFASSQNLSGRCSADEVALTLGKLRQDFRERSIVSTPGGVSDEPGEPGALRTLLCKSTQAAGPVYWSQTLLDLVQRPDATLKGFGNEDPLSDNHTGGGRAGNRRFTICVTVSKSSQVNLT
jgi:hypothetical protein